MVEVSQEFGLVSVDARVEQTQSRILTIRGQKVLLDTDLARFYGVKTAHLNQAVKRNAERFPEDFAFRLEPAEKAWVITNCDDLADLQYSPHQPLAFTEHGVVAAAFLVRTPKAVSMSRLVVKAFVEYRRRSLVGAGHYQELLGRYDAVVRRLEVLEQGPALEPAPGPAAPARARARRPRDRKPLPAKEVVALFRLQDEVIGPWVAQIRANPLPYREKVRQHLGEVPGRRAGAGELRSVLGIPVGSAGAMKRLSDAVRRYLLDPLVAAGALVREGQSVRTVTYRAVPTAAGLSPLRRQFETLRERARARALELEAAGVR